MSHNFKLDKNKKIKLYKTSFLIYKMGSFINLNYKIGSVH